MPKCVPSHAPTVFSRGRLQSSLIGVPSLSILLLVRVPRVTSSAFHSNHLTYPLGLNASVFSGLISFPSNSRSSFLIIHQNSSQFGAVVAVVGELAPLTVVVLSHVV